MVSRLHHCEPELALTAPIEPARHSSKNGSMRIGTTSTAAVVSEQEMLQRAVEASVWSLNNRGRYTMKSRFKCLAPRAATATAFLVLTMGSAAAHDLPKVKQYIDLNHVASSGMQTYPGLSLVNFSDYEPRFTNTALIDQVSMLGITSTYVDAPYHVDPNGATIADGRPQQRIEVLLHSECYID
jgi:hypothetical protein